MKKYIASIFSSSAAVALAAALTMQGVNIASADSLGPLNFESYTVGNINGQDGWTKTGPYDVAVVANTYGYSAFGAKSLRISDAVTSGSFGDQAFAKPLADAVGETSATAGTFTVGTRQRHFEVQFDIASAVPSAQQPGLHLSVSPDRGDGSRMSYLRFEDGAAGINVFFDDVSTIAPCTPSTCATFVESQIATGLSRSVPHTVRLTMDVYDGPSNDVVKVYIDGTLVKTGTSWENYYRYDPEAAAEQTPRVVKTMLFRAAGPAIPADSGKGFLIDNLTLQSGPIPPASWVKYSGNPVVPTNTCILGMTPARPAVVVTSPNNYKMYFTTHPGTNGAQIYMATTSNGGQTWTCANSNNPVLSTGISGAWDDTRVVAPTVILDGAMYKMWYTGRNAAGVYGVGYATSSNGTTWTKAVGNPVFTIGPAGAWDSQIVREPSVVKAGSTYHMWYSGTSHWPYFKIGHATSPDGITWTRDAANPVLKPTSGAWDANEAYAPSVVLNGSAFEMFYSGNAGGHWVTGHATSPDGTAWTKDNNAILSMDTTGWNNADSTDYVGAALDGTTWKVFYSGGGTSSGYQIGLATLQNTPQLTFRQLSSAVGISQSVVVNIDATGVSNMWGYQFSVNYDPTVFSAVPAYVNTSFDTGSSVAFANTPTCSAGVCTFYVTKKGVPGVTAFSGSGTLAQVTLTALNQTAKAFGSLTFSGDILSDINATALAHTTTTGWVEVLQTATVNGQVLMQGRPPAQVDSGTVTLYDQYGYAPATTVNYAPNTGNWSATVLFSGESTTFDILAAHPLYLSNLATTAVTLTNGGTFTQGPTTLKGGDANNDGLINISDLTCIGGDFGGPPTNCTGGANSSDITHDGTVNILDLVLAGGNYLKSSPQSW